MGGPIEVTLPRVFDAHLHLRDGDLLRRVAPASAAVCDAAVVMPNVPETCDEFDARRYRRAIEEAAGPEFAPLMTIKLKPGVTTPALVEAAATEAYAAKLYPEGATTASHGGVRDPLAQEMFAIYDAMQNVGMVLCVHGEDPTGFVLDRERIYLDAVGQIVRRFPGLKVVLEHVTTKDAVDFVKAASVNVAATITAHHLRDTLDAVLGQGLRPHRFCYPVPKRPEDRAALVQAAVLSGPEESAAGRFFFGSDSAPHEVAAKEAACGCAGVFSAPTMVESVAETFFGDGTRPWAYGPQVPDAYQVARLADFLCHRGRRFYGLGPADPARTLTLRLEPTTVPDRVAGLVPFRAGETIPWRVVQPGRRGD